MARKRSQARLEERRRAIDELARTADLPAIADENGMQVVGIHSGSPKAICPYHDDHRPSLNFRTDGETGRGYYHCYVCGAHGDLFDLVKKLRGCDFPHALDWVAKRFGVSIPAVGPPESRTPSDPRPQGLELAFNSYCKQTLRESKMLATWADNRGFETDFLKQAEVFAASGNKLSKSLGGGDRERVDALQAAGLIIRGDEQNARRGKGGSLGLDLPPYDLFSRDRIVFSIRDIHGDLVGFAARAVGEDTPKYLFSQRFPRSETLYRLDHVLTSIRGATQGGKKRSGAERVVDLFVVEGLVDALRLECLKIPTVAVLGSRLTKAQMELLADFARQLDRDRISLAVHLFLDSDEAGRRGMVATVPQLLTMAETTRSCFVDVILPPRDQSTQGLDPDDLLREVTSNRTAQQRVAKCCRSAMELLLSDAFHCEPEDLPQEWTSAPTSLRMAAFRDVERCLAEGRWPNVLDRVQPFERWLGGGVTTECEEWQIRLEHFLRATSVASAVSKVTSDGARPIEKDERARLLHALQLAQSSTQRRELPVDEWTWERMLSAVDVVILYLQQLLASPPRRNETLIEPMVAVKVPRPDGDFRLKALPCPEVLTLEQYILDEILRDYSETPQFMESIPAVRYWRGRTSARIQTTGLERFRPADSETVSFAYQIDMDVLEGRIPPKQEGMFRPYYPCWQEFIAFIDRRVSECSFPKLHVARLDVRRYYDCLPRHAVRDVLLPSLQRALHALAQASDDERGVNCAGLFLPNEGDPESRARAIADWLCDVSFHYKFLDPGTGKTRTYRWRDRGVPQGPDLSAYLANIALFPLDRAVSYAVRELDAGAERSGAGKVGGVYARYVDDLIIVAPSATELSNMRSLVESRLAQLGLELNKKAEPLPPMTPSEVRKWLTNRKGGLRPSGPFGGPPVNQPLGVLEPLADAGHLDRSDALSLLYDERFGTPSTPLDEVKRSVRLARRADELRHNDLVTAASRLWRCAIEPTTSEIADPCSWVVNQFVTLWKETSPQPARGLKHADSDNALASTVFIWLDGLERFIRGRMDRSPSLSSEAHVMIAAWREKTAHLIHQGLLGRLITPERKHRLRQFEHMLELKELSVYWAACVISRPSEEDPFPDIPVGESPAKARFLISIAQARQSATDLDRAEFHGPEVTKLTLLLHESIVRLMVTAGVNPDPLVPIKIRIQELKTFYSALNEDSKLLRILELWLPDTDVGEVSKDLAEAAAIAIVNVAEANPADILDKRDALRTQIICGHTDWPGDLLPVPTGVGTPGLLARTSRNDVFRVDFRETEEFCPTDLQWQFTGQRPEGTNWTQSKASLGNRQLLQPLKSIDDDDNGHTKATRRMTLPWVAQVFRSLAEHYRDEDAELSCPVTAYHILGPDIESGAFDPGKWETLGYPVPRNRLSGQAFVRHGRRGLFPEPVPEGYDHLWRIGTAIADRIGYIEKSSSVRSLRLSVPAIESGKNGEWAVDAMLRFSLHRLRGSSLPAGKMSEDTESGLPRTIERVLRRLQGYPAALETTQLLPQLAYLLATLAEGRALYCRSESTLDPAAPGAAVSLLADIVKTQFHPDEELASQLPQPKIDETRCPKRRPALAWFLLSERLEQLVDHDPLRETDPTLQTLAAGARVLALETQLRSQALEQWALLRAARHAEMSESTVDIGAWGLGSDCLLCRSQQNPGDAVEVSAGNDGVPSLMKTLHRATSDNSATAWNLLDDFTPLGWLVVLGSLTGILPGGSHGRGLSERATLTRDHHQNLADLANALAASADDSTDRPWGDLQSTVRRLSPDFAVQAFHCLEQLDDAGGIRVKSNESPHFRISGGREDGREITSSDGVREISAWQTSVASLTGEHPGRGTEQFRKQSGADTRLWFRWSETWYEDLLLSVGVIQPGIASLAGLAGAGTSNVTEASAGQVASPDESPSDYTTFRQQTPATTEATGNGTERQTARIATSNGIEAAILEERDTETPKERDQTIRDVKDFQRSEWSRRPDRIPAHVRIALLQWDVDDSYRHPIFEACMRARPDIEHCRREPHRWNRENSAEHLELPSCAEHRRRKILTSALDACKVFHVSVLLLPEYSVRPETVRWLKETLPSLAPETSVWAGTYRKPPFLTQPAPEASEWSAVMPVLVPRDTNSGPAVVDELWRTKKYPSVALNEQFRPWQQPLVPIYGPTDTTPDPKGYIFELICSEVFLATSPSNLYPVVFAHRQLCQSFGLVDVDPAAGVEETARQDLLYFAKHTSICCDQFKRRSIILVPAMTTRAADFAVLGQAGFLAAGLTTVFCNAAGKSACGHSCFVGHDGWDREANPQPGLAIPGPYHGVLPGIFRPRSERRGWLGKKEQALVIADIDPVYSFEGRPRPQMLPIPLRLVAHLPIIESSRPKPESEVENHWCRCKRMQPTNPNELFDSFHQVFLNADRAGYDNTTNDGNPGAVARVLCQLTKFGEPRGWLRARMQAYLAEHAANPQCWPPPVAVDWLWVETIAERDLELPRVEVPRYTTAAGELIPGFLT